MPPNHISIFTRAHSPINLSWLWETGDRLKKGFNDPVENHVLLPLYERLITVHTLVIPYLMCRSRHLFCPLMTVFCCRTMFLAIRCIFSVRAWKRRLHNGHRVIRIGVGNYFAFARVCPRLRRLRELVLQSWGLTEVCWNLCMSIVIR